MKKQDKKKKIDDQATIDLQINIASRLMEDVITELATNVQELFQFSYELLKVDVDQEHTYDLLNG